MKKQMYGIIGLGAAVAVLGGGLAVLKLTDKSGDDNSSSSVEFQETTVEGADLVLIEDSDKAVGSHTSAQEHYHGSVKEVKVTNEHGTMEAVLKTPADAEKGTSAVYTIKGFEDLPLDDSEVEDLADNIDALTSSSLIEENCTDFDKFGLENPAVTVEVKYESGRSHTLYVGDISPVSNQTYVRVDDSKTVYTVTNGKMADYKNKPEDFISLTMLEKPEDDAYPKVESLRIVRDDIDYDIYMEYGKNSDIENSGGGSATHVLVEPTSALLTVEKSSLVTNGMFGLKAESVKYAHFTDKQLEETGLSKPFCTADMKCDDGNEYVIYMSQPFKDDDGVQKAYAMFSDSKIIYTVTTEKAQWATVVPDDIVSRMMVSNYVWNISEIAASNATVSEKFSISMRDSSIKTNEAKIDDVVVKRNGEGFDTERYRLFYAFLVNLHAENLALGEAIPEGKPMATVTIKDSLLNETTTYEFYEYSVMKGLVVINGESKFFCSMKNAQALADNISRIATGESYIEAT